MYHQNTLHAGLYWPKAWSKSSWFQATVWCKITPESTWEAQNSKFSCSQIHLVASGFCTEVSLTNLVSPCCALALAMFCLCLWIHVLQFSSKIIASFPGPAQLSVASNFRSRAGRAWERGYKNQSLKVCFIHTCPETPRHVHIFLSSQVSYV